MQEGASDLDDESIGGLFGRLIDDGANLLRAEVNLQRASIADRLAEARFAIVLAAVAFLLVSSSLVGLMVGCVIALSRWLGPVGAGIIVTLITLTLAGLLVWIAVRQFSAADSRWKHSR